MTDQENLFPFSNMLDDIDTGITTQEAINPADVMQNVEETKTPIEDALEDNVSDNGAKSDTTDSETAEKKERKKPNRPITKEDADFVIANLKTMSYPEMAEKCGLTKHQVSRILSEVKRELRDNADGPEQQAKVEKFITNHLTKPEDQRGNAGEVKAAIREAARSIYQSL